MYNFVKLEGEEIILIKDESILKKDDKEVIISTIVTNKRLLLLDYPEKSNNYEEVLRTSRGSDYVLQKELILAVELKEITNIVDGPAFDKYVLNSSNYFYLKDNDIKNKLKELI